MNSDKIRESRNSIESDLDRVPRVRTLSDVESTIIIKSRINYGGVSSATKGFFYEYFYNTTIHGLRYIFSVHLPLYEKIFWLICTAISFYFAILMSWRTFRQWQDAPVIVTFDETLVPVHKIPFPTVTICPEIKFDRQIFNFTEIAARLSKEIEEKKPLWNFDNNTEEDVYSLANFSAVLQICDDEVIEHFQAHMPTNIHPDVALNLLNVKPDKNGSLPMCKWDSQFMLCEDMLSMVATSEGICYQFNAMDPQDVFRNLSELSYYDAEILSFRADSNGSWSPENGYIDQGYVSYPRRTVFSAIRNGFFAFLRGFDQNVEYSCRNRNQGYKVYFSSPESPPLTTTNHILVAREEEVIISVLPQYITADKSLKDFSPEDRQCYFNEERFLRYFKHYSEANCQTECLSNFTINRCGCAKFWMPKPFEVPVCQITDILCANQAKIELERFQQSQTAHLSVDPQFSVNCGCMPSCSSLEYNVEISRARYDLKKLLQAWKDYTAEEEGSFGSRLSVFFKEAQFTAIRRTVLFNLTSFLANCGGILGLFIGFSGLSLAELFYFICVRSCFNLQKRRRIRKKIQMLYGN